MKRDFDTVLNDCLEMLARGASVDACLQAYPEHANRLRPLLAAATDVRRVRVPQPSGRAIAAGEAALLTAVSRRRAEMEAQRSRRGWGLFKPLAMLGAAAALALIGLVAAGTDIFHDAFDFGTTTTEAQEFSGFVTTVADDGAFEMATDEGAATIVIDEDTVIELTDGSRVDITVITPGTELRIRGRQRGDGLVQAIEIRIEVRVEAPGLDNRGPGQGVAELEFDGQVVAISDGTLTVETPAGTVTVVLTVDTEVEGQLQPGVTIEVHGTQEADGTITAREIDVEDEDGDNSGSGSHNSGSGSGDSGSGSED